MWERGSKTSYARLAQVLQRVAPAWGVDRNWAIRASSRARRMIALLAGGRGSKPAYLAVWAHGQRSPPVRAGAWIETLKQGMIGDGRSPPIVGAWIETRPCAGS